MGLFSSSVIQLTPKNFDKKLTIVHPKLDGSTLGLVAFYTGWCSYCQRMSSPYSKASDTLGSAFPMFAFDCEKYPDLAKQVKVVSYPTIRYINKDGSLGQVYKGERTVDGFLADICKKSSKCN